MTAIEVDRDAFDRVRTVEERVPEPGAGEALVRVESFALTANNITYAVFGDAMRYWDFFPAAAPWGRIPVWGFGSVVTSDSRDLRVGERLYGYFPMSSHLVLTPGRADERGVYDTAPHRAGLSGAYNRYARCAADPVYRADREDLQMLLFPLFFTSFVIDDLLGDNDDFGAEQIVISSASSKTALGVAHCAHQRGLRVVGLTSPGNAALVESLGVVDEVRRYDDVSSIAPVSSVFVDVAGNADVRHAVHTHLADHLAHSMAVGGTHWDQEAAEAGPLPGPEPAFFFAPSQISKRSKEWGRTELDARVGGAWTRFADWAEGWVELRHASGPDAVIAAYQELLAGRADPRHGQICSLAEPA
ncbi:MAG: DUF2855 family protein [Acidimicrobiales bacterium]